MKNKIVAIILIIGIMAGIGLNVYNHMTKCKYEIVILVMDVWKTLPHEVQPTTDVEDAVKIIEWNRWWYNDVEKVVEDKIVPLLEWARGKNIKIVFSNLGYPNWDVTLNPLLEQDKYNEPIINQTSDLDNYLKSKEIDKIYYCGFAINNCILGKPTGMRRMYDLGYEVNLIEDAALSSEYQAITHEEAIEFMIKNLETGFTTVEDFERIYGG